MADEIDALLAEMTGGENGTKREQESEATGNSNKQRHTKRADLEAAAAAILATLSDPPTLLHAFSKFPGHFLSSWEGPSHFRSALNEW